MADQNRDYEFNQGRSMTRQSNQNLDQGQYGGRGYGDDYGQRGYSRGSSSRDFDYGQSDFEPTTTWTYAEFWLVPGPMAGKGPKNYQRSDDRICEDVNERLTQHGQIDATDIDVDIDNGEVTLKGTVNNRREKRLAEDIVDSVQGVKDVHNQLRIKQNEQNQGQQQMQHQGQQHNQGQQQMQGQQHQQKQGQQS